MRGARPKRLSCLARRSCEWFLPEAWSSPASGRTNEQAVPFEGRGAAQAGCIGLEARRGCLQLGRVTRDGGGSWVETPSSPLCSNASLVGAHVTGVVSRAVFVILR